MRPAVGKANLRDRYILLAAIVSDLPLQLYLVGELYAQLGRTTSDLLITIVNIQLFK